MHNSISAQDAAKGAKTFDFLQWDAGNLYWCETRPLEKGRVVLMCMTSNNDIIEKTSLAYSVRSSVYEYGGKAYTVHNGVIYFIHFQDQALYRQDETSIRQLTDGNVRLADLIFTKYGLVAVAETIQSKTTKHFLVLIDPISGLLTTLANGADFYASPMISHDNKKLAWITWSHPHMPWNESELWTADWHEGQLTNQIKVAGKKSVSIMQPKWGVDGSLYYLSDESGWWNLYQQKDSTVKQLYPMKAEFGIPSWELGTSTWDICKNLVLAAFQEKGQWSLMSLLIESDRNHPHFFDGYFSTLISVKIEDDKAACLVTFPERFPQIFLIDLTTKKIKILDLEKKQRKKTRESYTHGQHFTCLNAENIPIYAFYYPPRPSQKKPPLLVQAHGGPTYQHSNCLDLSVQYWTSHGFAVLLVNYRGSSGYGRHYRESLNSHWGIYDWQDCEAAAQSVIKQGLADPEKLVINGQSSGGYTALCALTFGSLFVAGASYYGISDLSLLRKETHKFESFYLEQLVGKYSDAIQRYEERSPFIQVKRASKPLIFFQGVEDKIVPANQSQRFHQALKSKGVKTELILYENEGHGFCHARTIQDSLEKELKFYLELFEKI